MTCTGPCGRDLPEERFPIRADRPGRRRTRCYDCKAEAERMHYAGSEERRRAQQAAASRRHRMANRSDVNARNRESARQVRDRLLAAYGGSCACCGEDCPEFLCLDHVDGVPPEHRQASGRRKATINVYRLVLAEGCPTDKYRLLCFNCNNAVAIYGSCPHERRLELVS